MTQIVLIRRSLMGVLLNFMVIHSAHVERIEPSESSAIYLKSLFLNSTKSMHAMKVD